MTLKARLWVLILCFAFLLQSCGPAKSEPDSKATVAVAIQQTLTAQSILITATALHFSRLTPTSGVTAAFPFGIPNSGDSTPTVTAGMLTPGETPIPIPTNTLSLPLTLTDTPTMAATTAVIATSILGQEITGFETSTPPATVTAAGAATQTPSVEQPETSTPSPSPMTGASLTSSPTQTPLTAQMPPAGAPMLSVNQPTTCRAGPGISYDLLGYLFPENDVAVVGVDTALNYWIVMNPDANGTCWVWGGYTTVRGETGALPTVVPPPPPELPRISVRLTMPCRSGPGTEYTILNELAANASADLRGRLSSLNWWLIRNPNGSGNCWIPGEQATIAGNVQSLPVLDIPAAATQTPTVPPTSTPTVTPTATIDLSAYQCKLVSKAVRDNTIFRTGANLDGNWVVRNTGSAAWDAGVVEYRFVKGAEMYKYQSAYTMQKRVAPGRQARILVDMVAPLMPGRYAATWGLAVNGQVFCRLPMSIVVVQP